MSLLSPTETTIQQNKCCPQCHNTKDITLFRKDRSKASGYGSICKACLARKRREYYVTHKEESKQNHDQWVAKNREYLRQYVRVRKGAKIPFTPKSVARDTPSHAEVVAKRKQTDKAYRQRTADHQREYRKKYNATHRKESAERIVKREAIDLQFKLANRLRARTRLALQAQSAEKATRSCELLGCTFAFFREWIEKQFTAGMTWENWGRGTDKWHLDHIRPVSSFDLTDPEQQKQCFHYTNVRPLWAVDNLSKGPKLCHVNM